MTENDVECKQKFKTKVIPVQCIVANSTVCILNPLTLNLRNIAGA